MAKKIWAVVVVFSLAACENSASNVGEANGSGQSADSAMNYKGDSAKAKGDQTLEVIKGKLGRVEDSLNQIKK